MKPELDRVPAARRCIQKLSGRLQKETEETETGIDRNNLRSLRLLLLREFPFLTRVRLLPALYRQLVNARAARGVSWSAATGVGMTIGDMREGSRRCP